MASLKDILPLLLAGGAGAASPQGADVFNNILRQKRIGEQQDRQDKESEQRLTLAQMASDRAGRSEERAITNQEGSISLRQMRMDQIDRQNADRDRSAASEKKRVDYMIGENQDLAETGLIDNSMTLEDVEAVIKSRDPGRPTWEEGIDRMQALKERNLSGSVDTEGGRVGTGQSSGPKAEKEAPEFNEVMAQEIFLDAQPAIEKAEEGHAKAKLEYDLLMEQVGTGEEVSQAQIESASMKLARKSQMIRDARQRVPLGFAKAGASQAQIDRLMAGAEQPQQQPQAAAGPVLNDPAVLEFYARQQGGTAPAPTPTPTPTP